MILRQVYLPFSDLLQARMMSGSLTQWNYDFGDGINATGKSPVHTYQFPGTYNVTLSVMKNDAGNASVVSNVSVQKGLIMVDGT